MLSRSPGLSLLDDWGAEGASLAGKPGNWLMFGCTMRSTRAIFSGGASVCTVTGPWYHPCLFVSLGLLIAGADIVCWWNALDGVLILDGLSLITTGSLKRTVGGLCRTRSASASTAWLASWAQALAPSRGGVLFDVMSNRVNPRCKPMSQFTVLRLPSVPASAAGNRGGGWVASASIIMGDGFRLGGDTGWWGTGSNDSIPGNLSGVPCWGAGFATGCAPPAGLWNCDGV